MYPTLQDSSYVVGKFVEDWDTLSNNRVCVVVTANDGVIVKRVVNSISKYGTLYCKSDNRDYPHLSIHIEDVKEIWECKMHLSFEFLDPVTNYQKIAELESLSEKDKLSLFFQLVQILLKALFLPFSYRFSFHFINFYNAIYLTFHLYLISIQK